MNEEEKNTIEELEYKIDTLIDNQETLERKLDKIIRIIDLLNVEKTVQQIEYAQNSLEEKYTLINEKYLDNINRLNFMTLELKGLVSIVRPLTKQIERKKADEHEMA